jgi:hypothetical protein
VGCLVLFINQQLQWQQRAAAAGWWFGQSLFGGAAPQDYPGWCVRTETTPFVEF